MNGSRQKAVGSKQRTEVGSGKRACAGLPRQAGPPRRARLGGRAGRSEVGKLPLIAFALLATSYFLLPTSAIAGTHVAATYDLGANPRVMATVNGTPQYGLVFAQRNKRVTYGEVEYGPSVVKGYLNSSGQLNDGGGNLWLDLIPNLGATPGDSYYVVTFNIQGRVHAEIWVVSDVASVAAEVCRQAQPPSSTAPALFYQFLQQAGDDLPQRQKLNFAGSGVSCVDNAGQLRTDCAFSGGGGGSVPKASATVSGTVKTDVTASDPAVYLQSSTDSLLSGKVSATRNVSTSSPLSGGGPLSSDLTLSCPTCSVSGHSHAEGDVSNLVSDLAGKVPTSRTISTTAPLQGGGDLSANRTFYIDLFGTAPGTKVVSTSLGGDPATDNCVKWIAGGKLGDTGAACGSGGSGDNISVNGTAASDADFDDLTPAAPSNAINVKWQKDTGTPNNVSAYLPYAAPLTVSGGNLTADSSVVRNSQANTYTAGSKQTFQNSATTAGANLASSADPSTPAQGDLWINASDLKFRGASATQTVERQANKDAASGYAGLTAGTKLTAAEGQEVWASTDLSDFASKSGTGTAIMGATFTSLAANDLSVWDGSKWVNATAAAKATALAADPSDCTTNQFANAIAASGNLSCAALTLASAQFANQGTTTTLLHGAASGNPSWAGVSLTIDATANQGTATTLLHGNAAGQPTFGSVTASDTDKTTFGTLAWGNNAAFTWSFDDNAATNPSIGFSAGGITLTATGTDQNITLTPSGTGVGKVGANTIETQNKKDAASGYAGLTAGTKLTAAEGQEVWGAADLTDYSGTSGTGSTAIKATFTSLTANDVVTWDGSNWKNQAPSGGSSHALLSATHTDTDAATAVLGDLISGNATPHWQRVAGNTTATKKYLNQTGNGSISAVPVWDVIADGDLPSSIARDSEISLTNLAGGTAGANSYDFAGASVTRPLRRLAFSSFPGTCTALTDIIARSDPATAGQALYLCNSSGNGWDLVGDGGGGSAAFSSITTGTNTGATMTVGNGATLNGAAGGIVDFSSLTPTTGFKVPIGAGAVPTANGLIAYDSTVNDFVGGSNSATVKLIRATAALTSGQFVQGSGNGAVAASGYTAIASGTAGVGPAYVGTATTLARSDHDHRTLQTKTWFFPGTPATGVQNLVLTFPEAGVNFAITDMRVTANSASTSSSTFNIQRCVVSSVACSATQSTYVDIYSTVLTLAASNYTVSKGSAPNQNVGSLVGGDRFKASLVTIGALLTDVTVAMTYKVNTAN